MAPHASPIGIAGERADRDRAVADLPAGARSNPGGAVSGCRPCAAALAPAINAAAGLPRLHSLLVSRRGELVVERYFRGTRATTPANLKSASKAVISALVGIAIDRKLIPGVGAPIAPYFPDLLGPGSDSRKRKITIEDLLTMRSGLESTSIRNYGAWVQSPNWVRLRAHAPADRRARRGHDLQHGQLPSAVRHPDEGERRSAPGRSPARRWPSRSASRWRRGRRIRRASTSAATRC